MHRACECMVEISRSGNSMHGKSLRDQYRLTAYGYISSQGLVSYLWCLLAKVPRRPQCEDFTMTVAHVHVSLLPLRAHHSVVRPIYAIQHRGGTLRPWVSPPAPCFRQAGQARGGGGCPPGNITRDIVATRPILCGIWDYPGRAQQMS